jgi:uncharacterized protein (DUF2267 family)
VEYKEFIATVQQRTGLSRQESADLSRATSETLGERLSEGEALQLSVQLPDGLSEYVRPHGRQAERFGLDEFIKKVSDHTGLTEPETTAGVRAVLLTLRDAVSPDQFGDVMSQLPGDFATLVQGGDRQP